MSTILDAAPSGPIFIHRGEEQDAMLAIHEEWFEKIEPIYRYLPWIAGPVGVREVPPGLNEAAEFLTEFVLEFGALGWAFSFSILWYLNKAAKGAINIGKFAYSVVGYGRNYSDQYGRDRRWVIEEIE